MDSRLIKLTIDFYLFSCYIIEIKIFMLWLSIINYFRFYVCLNFFFRR